MRILYELRIGKNFLNKIQKTPTIRKSLRNLMKLRLNTVDSL